MLCWGKCHVDLCVVVVQFNMPIEVNWEVMDTQLLQRFWSGHPSLRRGSAHLQERVMVFHRGIHTVSLRRSQCMHAQNQSFPNLKVHAHTQSLPLCMHTHSQPPPPHPPHPLLSQSACINTQSISPPPPQKVHAQTVSLPCSQNACLQTASTL